MASVTLVLMGRQVCVGQVRRRQSCELRGNAEGGDAQSGVEGPADQMSQKGPVAQLTCGNDRLPVSDLGKRPFGCFTLVPLDAAESLRGLPRRPGVQCPAGSPSRPSAPCPEDSGRISPAWNSPSLLARSSRGRSFRTGLLDHRRGADPAAGPWKACHEAWWIADQGRGQGRSGVVELTAIPA